MITLIKHDDNSGILVQYSGELEVCAEFTVYKVVDVFQPPNIGDLYFRGNIKWDGCSNLSVDRHMCGHGEWKEFSEVMDVLWNDVVRRIKQFDAVEADCNVELGNVLITDSSEYNDAKYKQVLSKASLCHEETEEYKLIAKKMQEILSRSHPKQYFESGVAFNTENINNTIKEYVNILKKRYEELVKQGWNPIVVGFIIENDDCLIDFTQDINGVYGSKFLFDGNRLSSKAKTDISILRRLLKPNQNIVWEI